jgi:hypothetical protein
MKNAIKALVLVALVAFAGIANAQNSASTTGTATARIIRPITLTANHDLAYGNFIPPASSAGTIVMSPAGVETYAPTAMQPGTQAGTGVAGGLGAATFTLTGEPSFTVVISRVTTGAKVSDGAGHTMNLTAFTTDAVSPNLDATGSYTYHVGATLNVAQNQVIGEYTTALSGGTPWTETVAYQ